MALNVRLPQVDGIAGISQEAPRSGRIDGFGLTSALDGGKITMGGRKKRIPVSYD